MPFDGWNTIEGRHLVFAYALVILLQGGYAAWIATQWLKLNSANKKQGSRANSPTSLSE